MGWLAPLRGNTVGLDTAPLISYIKEEPAYLPQLDAFFAAMTRGEFEVVTSTMTVSELLTHPVRENHPTLATAYRDILQNTEHLRIVPITADIVETAAQLHAAYNIRTPDAIQVATALSMNADFFLTADAGLSILPHPAMLALENLAKG